MHKKTLFYTLVAAAIFVFGQCEPPSRGCLDVEATNLDLSADRPCEDNCCTYPKLMISFNQEFGGQVWKPDTAYKNDLGHWFVISKASFYFSDFMLSQGNETYTTTDSVELKWLNGSDTSKQFFRNDFMLGRRIPLEYGVGTFRKSGIFDGFRCQMGLEETANKIISTKTPSGHPLNKQPDSLWLNTTDRFVWLQLIVKKDTMANTPLDTLRFTANDFGGQPYPIVRSGSFEHQTGVDFNIGMTVDFAVLFKGINLANIGQAAEKAKILNNLGSTFVVQ